MMRTAKFIAALGMLGGCAGWALPAAAQTYTETYSGTIDSGSVDAAGLFGTAGGNIGGDAITTTWQYSLTNGSIIVNNPGSVDEALGGTFYGTPSPMLSVSVTVNGITQIFFADYLGDTFLCSASYCGTPAVQAVMQDGTGNVIEDFIQNSGISPTLDLTATQIIDAQNNSSISHFLLAGDGFFYIDTSAAFNEVPEPSSLALLGGGLLAVGAVRRRQLAASASLSPAI